MHTFTKQSVSKLLLLILTLSVILSSLSSCIKPAYVAESKDEIRENVDASLSGDGKSHDNVYAYLYDWGMPTFDRIKFSYFEAVVNIYYNYAAVPNVKEHAAKTALAFLDEYYDDIELENKASVTDALLSCYVSTLGDPYAIYRIAEATDNYQTDMSGKFGGIGVMIEYDHVEETIMVSTVYPDSPAERAGVMVGDFIYAVDGEAVSDIGYLKAVDRVRGKIGTSVKLTLLRDGKLIDVSAVRDEVEEINVSYSIDEEKNIGYVQIVAFKGNTAEQFKNAIDALEAAGVSGIIFDLRGNPGGYLDSVVEVISYLIPSGNDIVSYQYKNSLKTTLKSKKDGSEDHVIKLPVVVLANEYTASAGEIFTAAIRDYREDGLLEATIVGTTTFKKGIMQSTFEYALDGSTVTMTIAYYDPPCGVNYHGTGVTPDVYVELPKPVLDTETGKYLPVEDTQLNTAIKELEKLINEN